MHCCVQHMHAALEVIVQVNGKLVVYSAKGEVAWTSNSAQPDWGACGGFTLQVQPCSFGMRDAPQGAPEADQCMHVQPLHLMAYSRLLKECGGKW